jgi:sulfur carrier protein ThiS
VKVNVRLFGTLSKGWPEYQHQQGLDIELPRGTTATGLLVFLKIESRRTGVVSMNGEKMGPDQIIEENARITIFQPICGG